MESYNFDDQQMGCCGSKKEKESKKEVPGSSVTSKTISDKSYEIYPAAAKNGPKRDSRKSSNKSKGVAWAVNGSDQGSARSRFSNGSSKAMSTTEIGRKDSRFFTSQLQLHLMEPRTPIIRGRVAYTEARLKELVSRKHPRRTASDDSLTDPSSSGSSDGSLFRSAHSLHRLSDFSSISSLGSAAYSLHSGLSKLSMKSENSKHSMQSKNSIKLSKRPMQLEGAMTPNDSKRSRGVSMKSENSKHSMQSKNSIKLSTRPMQLEGAMTPNDSKRVRGVHFFPKRSMKSKNSSQLSQMSMNPKSSMTPTDSLSKRSMPSKTYMTPTNSLSNCSMLSNSSKTPTDGPSKPNKRKMTKVITKTTKSNKSMPPKSSMTPNKNKQKSKKSK